MSRKCSLFMGLFIIASMSVFTSCKDYDDDIADLRNQISTNATDLSSLVDSKLSSVEAEISALSSQSSALESAYKSADAALETAIKDATNDAKGYADIQAAAAQKAAIAAAQELVDNAVSSLQTALDAANQTISEQGQTIQSLLAADAALQDGITAAQARADEAYVLAAQAQAQVEGLSTELSTELSKITSDLATINETLTSLQDQLNVLGESLAAVQQATAENAAMLEAQEAAIEDLKASNEEALAALAATDDELRGLIEASQASIEKLESALADAKAALEEEISNVQSYVDQEVAAVSEALSGAVDGLNTKISEIENAYKSADADLADKISSLQEQVDTNTTDIAKITAQIVSINELLARLLNDNVNNLITSIIVQDRESYNVYAQVVNSDGKADADGNIWFPYKGFSGSKPLKVGEYNIQEYAGYIYATVNPADIDATKVSFELRDSRDDPNGSYEIGKVNPASGHLITRATSNNGLWRMEVKASYLKSSSEPEYDKALYALTTSYDQKVVDSEGQDSTVTKRVYSHYALQLNPKRADEAVKTDLSVKGVNATVGSDGEIMFSALNGDVELGTNGVRVYEKFVEAIQVEDSKGNVVTGGDAAFNSYNSGFLSKIFDAKNEGDPDTISLACPDEYKNYKITLRYYVWNYDGTIKQKECVVVFNKVLWGDDETTIEDTPESANPMTTPSKEFPEFSFVKGVKCTNNTTWSEEAYSVGATCTDDDMKDAVIELTSSDGNTTYETVTVNDAGDPHAMTPSTLASIKNMSITVDPANIEPEKEYVITLTFYDRNGYVVNNVRIKYTMHIPPANVDPFPISAAFYGELTIAWADVDIRDGNYAQYAFKGSFAPLNEPENGYYDGDSPFVFELTYPDKYATGGENAVYDPYSCPEESNSYTMEVPNEAVVKEHVYDMTAGIEFYGLSNLISSHYGGWDYNFQIKFLSPIKYSIIGTKGYIEGKTYEGIEWEVISVNYRNSVTINDSYFKALDPKEAIDKQVGFFDKKDYRIETVSVTFLDPTDGNNKLFSDIVGKGDGTWDLITSESVSVTENVNVWFLVTVTDVWGVVTDFEFPVKVIANK